MRLTITHRGFSYLKTYLHRIALLVILLISFGWTNGQCNLSNSNTTSTSTPGGDGTVYRQTFTAPCTANLLSVYANFTGTIDWELRIREGESSTGNLLFSRIHRPPFRTITLPTPIPLTEGQTYQIEVKARKTNIVGEKATPHITQNNTYTGGKFFIGENEILGADLGFSITMDGTSTCTNPTINAHPASFSTGLNGNCTFQIYASGTDLSYQWQVSSNNSSFSNVNGATSSTLQLGSFTEPHTAYYRCVVSSGECSTTTNSGTLIVQDCNNPTITSGADYTQVVAGATATFKVTATGNNLTYQWYRYVPGQDPVLLEGKTAAILSFSNVSNELNETAYLCKVYSGKCVSTSGVGTLYVITCENPSPNLAYIAPVCSNAESFTLSGGSPEGGTYSIDGQTATTFNPSVLAVGTHTVTYTVGEGVCAKSATQTVVVKETPAVSLGEFESVCANAEPFALSSGIPLGGTYSGSSVSNGQFNPAAASTEEPNSIAYTVSNGGKCSATAYSSIKVNSTDQLKAPKDMSICYGEAPFNIGEYVYGEGVDYIFTGDGVENNIFNATVAGIGKHKISIESGYNCSIGTSFNITVTTPEKASISPVDTVVCANSAPVVLTASIEDGYFTSILSKPEDRLSDDGAILGNTFVPSDKYIGKNTIYYRYYSNGCLATVSTSITVKALPLVSISTNSYVICEGSSNELVANGSFKTMQWLANQEIISGATGITYLATESAEYQVKVSDGWCSNVSKPIYLKSVGLPKPAITAEGSDNFCLNNDVTLSTGEFSKYQWLLNGEKIADATSAAYSPAASGNYSVKVFNGTCYGTSAPVSVSSSSPVTISSDRNPVLCSGEAVVLSSSQASSYQWYKNGEKITDATAQKYPTTTGGTYHVLSKDENGCEAASGEIEVISNSLPTPDIANLGKDEFCVGESTQLQTAQFANYRWRKNGVPMAASNSATITIQQAGSYSVTVTNTAGCKATSTNVAIAVHDLPVAKLNKTGLIICEGDSLLLEAIANQGSYQWYNKDEALNGETDNTLQVSKSGTYRVKVTSAFGCWSKSSAAIAFVKPSPPKPIIVNSGNGMLLAQTNETDIQWYKDFIMIPDATTPEIPVEENGRYSVRVSNTQGCSNNSNAFYVTALNVSDYAQLNLKIYPNPFTEAVNIEATDNGQFTVTDLSGKTITLGKIDAGLNRISLPELASGVYHLNITIKDQKQVFKLVK